MTVLFTDIVDSTKLRRTLGEDRADAMTHRHDQTVQAVVDAHDGVLVKCLGDGALAVLWSAAAAVDAARELQQAMWRLARRYRERIEIRVGLEIGDVAWEAGDVLGIPVVVAARLCSNARPGQIVTSDVVARLAGVRGAQVFVPLGPCT